jgi:ubiquinone/menaquinone biosynthesis C-methylase UbiE
VDISARLVVYAHRQAEAQQVSDRVQFHLMDALGTLDFPDDSFDLVNQRFGTSFLRQWDWPLVLQAYLRVCKPGGVIRITEFDVGESSSSPALLRLSELFVQALSQAGHFFTREHNGLTSQLAPLLHQQNLQNVQTQTYAIEYHAGTSQGKFFIEDITSLYRTLLPFLRKWTLVPDNYEKIYQQALTEMQHPDFVATMNLLTAWGTTPSPPVP